MRRPEHTRGRQRWVLTVALPALFWLSQNTCAPSWYGRGLIGTLREGRCNVARQPRQDNPAWRHGGHPRHPGPGVVSARRARSTAPRRIGARPGRRMRARVMAADILLVNGRVWTGRDCPVGAGAPSAVGVTGTKIVAVGTDAELSRMRAAHTRVVDLAGRRVLPGLIDSHIHAIRAGLTYLDELDWTEVYGLSAAVDSVRAAAAQRPPGTWITALGGWHPGQFADEQRLPTLAELDAAAPAHPVFVHAVYAHDDWAVLNTAALQALGWCDRCPDPEGGTLPRRPDGTPDGRLVGLDAYQHVTRLALRPTADRAVASTRAYFTRLAALGLTGVIDAGGLGMSADK